MMHLPERLSISICAALLCAAPLPAAAQSASGYPSKPVRIIIPFAPGTNTDTVMNIYGEKFRKELGQAFVFDHRGGGDTIVGTTAAARATPDGYTLLTGTSTLLVNHWLAPDLAYDTFKDITLISTLTRSNSSLIINTMVPATNMKEFIAYAKANEGKVMFASTATAAELHAQRFMNATGTKLSIVNYKSATQAATDLMAGNVQGIFNNIANMAQLIKAGKLRGLGVAGDKRAAVAPDVPTFAEAGIKDFDPNNWIGLLAPSKTPRDIVEKLNLNVRNAQAAPEVVAALQASGGEPYGPMTAPQASEFMRVELERFGKLIKDAGMKPQGN